MKFGIIGLPNAGKGTVFTALTGKPASGARKGENTIGTIEVPDHRVDFLKELHRPKKTTRVQIEYLLAGRPEDLRGESFPWAKIRDCDALIHVLRNFSGYEAVEPSPLKDFLTLGQDLLLTDLMVVEKRLERIELDHKRGKKMDPNEHLLLNRCREILEAGVPLRKEQVSEAPPLKGYALVSAKPMLVLFNNEETIESIPDIPELTETETCVGIRGKIEQELAMMDPEGAGEFMALFGIASSAKERIIRKSFELLGCVTFFTAVGEEVRAWAVQAGSTALDAAGTVHSDMKRGFIRAEVISHEDLRAAGSYPEAKKRGTLRLEGKTYVVQDGDILNIRFNV